MKKGFTLGEVLITLGIIGVVAAMTISVLNKKIQHKILEVKFKKSVSFVQNIILRTKAELGIDSLYVYCKNNERQLCHSVIIEQLPVLNKSVMVIPSYSLYSNFERDANAINNYNNTKNASIKKAAEFYSMYYTNILKDGTFFGIYFINDLAGMNIIVDTNGISRPNQLGHDVFIFALKSTDDTIQSSIPDNNLTDEQVQAYYENSTDPSKDYFKKIKGRPCNLTSQREGNGLGCAYYALRNECPWDSTKTYWECLP